MYIAAPEYIWTIIAAILIAIFMLLVQKWFYNGKIYRTKEEDRQAILKFIVNLSKSMGDALSKTTNEKEEDSDEEDDDSDLDDIVDDFLK